MKALRTMTAAGMVMVTVLLAVAVLFGCSGSSSNSLDGTWRNKALKREYVIKGNSWKVYVSDRLMLDFTWKIDEHTKKILLYENAMGSPYLRTDWNCKQLSKDELTCGSGTLVRDAK